MSGNILVLGAGIYQIPIIERVKRLGFNAHVVSRPGPYPGIKLADQFHAIDTTDVDSVLRLARKLQVIASITAGSDVCIPTIGAINDALNLPGIKRDTADLMTYKNRFREFQQANNLSHPAFSVATSTEECLQHLKNFGSPAIIKPVDSSGSRGISKVSIREPEHLKVCFKRALSVSRGKRVCIESVISGTEVGGNALLYGGNVHFLAITAKHMQGFLVEGHSYPTNISQSKQDQIKMALIECCALLGYDDGALNFDVMVDGKTVVIIELGARFGGNGLTDLTERAFGYDIQTEMIKSILKVKPKEPLFQPVQACGSYVFGSPKNGTLTHIDDHSVVQEQLPWVSSISLSYNIGDKVPKMQSNADLIGYATFDIPENSSWEVCRDKIKSAINLKVES